MTGGRLARYRRSRLSDSERNDSGGLKQFVFEVDEVDFFGGTGDGRVEPLQVVQREFLLPERIVNEHAFPLSSLGFMACDGIGILQLQGIIIFILTDSLLSLLLGSKVGIILIDTLIQQIGLLIGQ